MFRANHDQPNQRQRDQGNKNQAHGFRSQDTAHGQRTKHKLAPASNPALELFPVAEKIIEAEEIESRPDQIDIRANGLVERQGQESPNCGRENGSFS